MSQNPFTEEMRAKAKETKLARGPQPSLRKAINGKCRDCIFDPKSGLGTWRQQTEGCTSVDCPLFPVRPRSSAPKAKTPLG